MVKVEVGSNSIKTHKEFQIIDITDLVKKYVSEHKVQKGMVSVTTQHTTTAIRINENEPRLVRDIQQYFYEVAPKNRQYLHDDIELRKNCPKDEPKNAHAHLKALLMGASETLPIIDGELVLGKWQKIFFIELDGPRERTFTFELVGE